MVCLGAPLQRRARVRRETPKRIGRAERRLQECSEPRFDEDDDVVEYGGELIYAVGYTEGGAPYGVPVAELQREAARDARGAGWARAKRVLRELFERETGASVEIGPVRKIGDGLAREIFAADVDLSPDPDRRSNTYVVALPCPDADPELDERTSTELRLVARLRETVLPFRLPVMAGAYPDGDRLALVRRFVAGIELDLRAGRQSRVRPWALVAEIASAIHGISGLHVADVVTGHATRLDHARAALSIFDDLEVTEMKAARSWAEAHLPPAQPSSLLHGDLLGQNILLSVDKPPCVIDWEYACRGDPAYDLAIITRAVRRPFQLHDGFERLLDVYRSSGKSQVTAAHVHVHELCLVAGWYRAALTGRSRHAPEQEIGQMRSLLRRLE